MEINALLMDEKDNVVTCVTEVAAGQDVVYRKGQEFCTVKAEENIPYCHKDAAKGHWVSHNNLVSVPRDYDSEMVQE